MITENENQERLRIPYAFLHPLK